MSPSAKERLINRMQVGMLNFQVLKERIKAFPFRFNANFKTAQTEGDAHVKFEYYTFYPNVS